MSLNNLLTWMSARECGSWSQFRAAVEELHVEYGDNEEDGENADDATAGDLPVYQVVRLNLQRLAHVEFYSAAAEADWRVVPPALAIHSEGDRWVGILCGARPPGLRDQLGHSGPHMGVSGSARHAGPHSVVGFRSHGIRDSVQGRGSTCPSGCADIPSYSGSAGR